MRTTRSRTTLILLAVALGLAGCGKAGARRSPSLGAVPLAAGVRIVAHTRSCDHGANAYCAVQAVMVGARYRSSTALLQGEEQHLHSLGWTDTVGDTPKERSADSPGHRLRLSFALATDDLESWDLGSLKRRPAIARALAQTMFERVPALSLMLLTGSS
jgi:hypothetical protein